MYLSIYQPNIHNLHHLKNKVLVPREHRERWLPIAFRDRTSPGARGTVSHLPDMTPYLTDLSLCPAGHQKSTCTSVSSPVTFSALRKRGLTTYMLLGFEKIWVCSTTNQSLGQLGPWGTTRRSYGEEKSPGWSGEGWATQDRKTAPSGRHLSASQVAHSQALLRSCRGFASQPWNFQILPVDT